MRLTFVLLLAGLLPVRGISAQQSSPPSVTLPPALQRVLTDYENAWQARDADALAALFHPDAFVMANGRPAVRGREAVRESYRNRGGPLALRAYAWAAEGDVGFIIGGWAGARGEPDVGKFSLTLRRDTNGRWLIVTDMDNGNR